MDIDQDEDEALMELAQESEEMFYSQMAPNALATANLAHVAHFPPSNTLPSNGHNLNTNIYSSSNSECNSSLSTASHKPDLHSDLLQAHGQISILSSKIKEKDNLIARIATDLNTANANHAAEIKELSERYAKDLDTIKTQMLFGANQMVLNIN